MRLWSTTHNGGQLFRRLLAALAIATGVLVAPVASVSAASGDVQKPGAGFESRINLPAAHPGSWSQTTAMHKPRSSALAVPLGSGKVLVAGGNSDSDTSAELYDPTTATWTTTGSALFPSQSPIGKPLFATVADGRVLAMRGAAAELYDPVGGRWSATGTALFAPLTLTLLPNGRVLGVGSTDAGGRQAELYDPASGRWLTTPGPTPLDHNIPQHAVLLPTGRVLVISVDTIFGDATAETYDPFTVTWNTVGAPTQTFTGPAVVLPSGQVLVVGFEHSGGSSAMLDGTAAIYTSATGRWTALPSASAYPDSLTLLRDGRVLLAGGESLCIFCDPLPPLTLSHAAQLFNVNTLTWSTTGSMLDSQGRPGHTGVLLPTGAVLAAGGSKLDASAGSTLSVRSSAELYTPPPATALSTTCTVSVKRTDSAGRLVVRVAVRDIGTGLQTIKVVQATNLSVTLPKFPSGSRDPAVITTTRVNQSLATSLKLSVTNRAGASTTCQPL